MSALTPKGRTLLTPSTPIRVGRDVGLGVEDLGLGSSPALLGQGRDRDDRPVDAGAELVGDRRVGRVRAGAGGLAAAVGQAQLDLADRHGGDTEHRHDGEDREPRVTGDEPDVPAAVLLLVLVLGARSGC